MSASAMPSFLSASITLVIRSAAASRAALTVSFVTETPRRRSATSGLRIDVARAADADRVFGRGVVGGEDGPRREGRGGDRRDRQPDGQAEPIQRMRELGSGRVTVTEVGGIRLAPIRSSWRRVWSPMARRRQTDAGGFVGLVAAVPSGTGLSVRGTSVQTAVTGMGAGSVRPL